MKIYFAFGCFPIFKELFILFKGGSLCEPPLRVFICFLRFLKFSKLFGSTGMIRTLGLTNLINLTYFKFQLRFLTVPISITVLKRFTSYKRARVWRKVSGYTYYICCRRFMTGYPSPSILGDPRRLGKLSVSFRLQCKDT